MLKAITDRLLKGQSAEQLALHYLVQQGLSLIARNYQCRLGEIDLIMQHHDTLVFVEVRYRKNNDYGGALASVDQRKQRKIRHTAEHFLQQHVHLQSLACRFDVVAICPDNTQDNLHWVANAFY